MPFPSWLVGLPRQLTGFGTGLVRPGGPLRPVPHLSQLFYALFMTVVTVALAGCIVHAATVQTLTPLFLAGFITLLLARMCLVLWEWYWFLVKSPPNGEESEGNGP